MGNSRRFLAAGHGNMYTTVLERTVQLAFQAILGLNFVSRNCAMIWYQSARILACCMKEIYGTTSSLNVLNWDFPMQDRNAHSYKAEMWVEWACTHPRLPIRFLWTSNCPLGYQCYSRSLKQPELVSSLGTKLLLTLFGYVRQAHQMLFC